SSEQAIKLLTPLAQVSGLSALALKASAAPGWVGNVRGGNGLRSNAELGYGLATRLACLRAEGFDPIDVGLYPSILGQDASLRFFPHTHGDGMWQAFNDFRLQQNQKSLEQVHAALHALAPQISLFLDDRASPYIDADTRWFGRWDDPKRIAINPLFYDESVAKETAFAGSPEPLLGCPSWSNKPGALAKTLSETSEKAVKKWPGIALDLTPFTPPEALQQLSGLPNIPVPPR
ncbi:MAG: hypothetical protein JWN14_3497, partial [Chthonomonadales bacterium]|nr:hypothetical protein [Chthonomonadales bacterium]